MRINSQMSAFAKASMGAAAVALALSTTNAADGLGAAIPRIALALEDTSFDIAAFGVFFAALFAIMNPVVAVPIFTGIAEGKSERERNRLAFVVTATVLVALVAAALFGHLILDAFGIGMPAFRIAAGLIVLLMGLSMLGAAGFVKSTASAQTDQTANRESEAICPLGIPLLAGPGSMAIVIIECEMAERASDFVTIGAVIVAMVLVVYVVLRVAVPIACALGDSGLAVLTRIMGMIAAAIAIDTMVTGACAAFPVLGS